MTYEKKNRFVASGNNMFEFHLPVPDSLCNCDVIRVVEFPNVIDSGEVLKPAWKKDFAPRRHRSGKAWKIFIAEFARPDTFAPAAHLIFLAIITVIVILLLLFVAIVIAITFDLLTVTA